MASTVSNDGKCFGGQAFDEVDLILPGWDGWVCTKAIVVDLLATVVLDFIVDVVVIFFFFSLGLDG